MSSSVIAIDGPAASGKSTVAGLVAERLNIPYLNTGNMFRAVAFYLLDRGFDFDSFDRKKLSALLAEMELDYKASEEGFVLQLNGRTLAGEIRQPEVTSFVSSVAASAAVRKLLLQLQRRYAAHGLIVMEGRDIGTVVFPDAAYKFFITASPLVRAQRRLKQSDEVVDGATLQHVADEIARRDQLDSTRAIAPLCQAADAALIDTSDLTIDEVVEQIVSKVKL